MRIALTGGSGFIGGHLARVLAARGHALKGLVRPTSRTDHLRAAGVALLVGDMSDETSLRALVEGADAVIHAAVDHEQRVVPPSRTFRETYLRKNLAGGSLLLEFAAQAGVPRVLLISTLEVYGSTLDPPLPPRDEDTPLAPDSLYGSTKYALERVGLTYGADMGVQVLRPGWVFGDQTPRGRNCFHPIVDRLDAGAAIPERIGAYMMWVEDLARVGAALVEGPLGPGRVFNAHAGFIDWADVARAGKDRFGSISEITDQPALLSPRPIIAERVRGLGVSFHTEEGILRTLEHIRRLPRERSQ
jgi:nucleoside-diphosphate-sugar epimerase